MNDKQMESFWHAHFSQQQTRRFMEMAACRDCKTILLPNAECRCQEKVELNPELIAFFAASEQRRVAKEKEKQLLDKEEANIEWIDGLEQLLPLNPSSKVIFSTEKH
jgi:hypothetical protein